MINSKQICHKVYGCEIVTRGFGSWTHILGQIVKDLSGTPIIITFFKECSTFRSVQPMAHFSWRSGDKHFLVYSL